MGEMSIFSGLVYCADCGQKMYLCRCTTMKQKEYFNCSSYRALIRLLFRPKVYRVSEIRHIFEYACNRRLYPYIWKLRFIGSRRKSAFSVMYDGRINSALGKYSRYLRRTIIVKDMSRLGRDYLKVGFYTEITFPEANVRFIAISPLEYTLSSESLIISRLSLSNTLSLELSLSLTVTT